MNNSCKINNKNNINKINNKNEINNINNITEKNNGEINHINIINIADYRRCSGFFRRVPGLPWHRQP